MKTELNPDNVGALNFVPAEPTRAAGSAPQQPCYLGRLSKLTRYSFVPAVRLGRLHGQTLVDSAGEWLKVADVAPLVDAAEDELASLRERLAILEAAAKAKRGTHVQELAPGAIVRVVGGSLIGRGLEWTVEMSGSAVGVVCVRWSDELRAYVRASFDPSDLQVVVREAVAQVVPQGIAPVAPAAPAPAAQPPRVTPDDIKAEIDGEAYFTVADGLIGAAFPNLTRADLENNRPGLGNVTLCVLFLRNGTRVVGVNYGAISPELQNVDMARRLAREDAFRQIWPLLRFRLRDKLAADAGGAA